jgi:hypothetical protein
VNADIEDLEVILVPETDESVTIRMSLSAVRIHTLALPAKVTCSRRKRA